MNAIFKYAKASIEQQRTVGDMLGPTAGLHVNEMPSEDVKESNLLDEYDLVFQMIYCVTFQFLAIAQCLCRYMSSLCLTTVVSI